MEMLDSGKGRHYSQEECRELLNVSVLNLGGWVQTCFTLVITLHPHVVYALSTCTSWTFVPPRVMWTVWAYRSMSSLARSVVLCYQMHSFSSNLTLSALTHQNAAAAAALNLHTHTLGEGEKNCVRENYWFILNTGGKMKW